MFALNERKDILPLFIRRVMKLILGGISTPIPFCN